MEQKSIINDPRKLDYYYKEAMKTLRTNILYSGKEVKTILVTSYFPDEGKSDIALQLTRDLGSMGKKVLLFDADIRKSALVRRYSVDQDVKGLSQYLSGQIQKEEILYDTNYENMHIIFAGPTAPNPAELLEQKLLTDLLKELRQKYDYIIIDTPPIGSVIDAAIVAKECDGAVLVIESDRVRYKDAQRVQEQLKKTGCRILGAVLNKVDVKKDRYYHRYHYYYYADRQKHEEKAEK